LAHIKFSIGLCEFIEKPCLLVMSATIFRVKLLYKFF